MTAPRHTPVRIPQTPSAAPLSAQQKKFNRHIERINEERALLSAWQEAIAAYRERHAREVVPLRGSHIALLVELVQHLDAASDDKKLSKAARRTLSEGITDRVADLIDAVPDEATRAGLKDIYNRHSGGDYDAEEAEDNEVAKEMAQAMVRDLFGVDLDLQGKDTESPEDLLRRIEEQMQAQRAQAEQQREAHQAKRRAKPNARERKAQEEAAQATQSVREIYRKLASSLHPDRETDPAERERKTALMQRVNQAYANNKLLDLLQLQLEAEHIDAAHLARVSEERLQHYNRVLTSQYQELQVEVQSLRAHLQAQLPQHVRLSSKPAGLAKIISTNVQYLRQDGLHLQRTMRALDEDPQLLKAWLKEQRRLFKEQESDFF